MHDSRSTASIIIRQSFYVRKQRVSHYSTQTIYCSCRADDKIKTFCRQLRLFAFIMHACLHVWNQTAHLRTSSKHNVYNSKVLNNCKSVSIKNMQLF